MTETTKTNVLERLTEGIAQLTSSERWQDWLTHAEPLPPLQLQQHAADHDCSVPTPPGSPGSTPGASSTASSARARRASGSSHRWSTRPTPTTTPSDDTTKVIRGFKPVPVFDLSQTDGQELPEICIRLTGDQPGDAYDHLRYGCTRSSGSPSRTIT